MSFLECLLSNRHEHVSSEMQSSGSGEMLSTDLACLNDNMQLHNSLLSLVSVSSLNSVPTSPSNAVDERPVFLQDKSPSLLRVAAERYDVKHDSNTDHLLENLPSGDKLPNLPNRDNLLQDCSAMSSSGDESLCSGESLSTGTRETGTLEDGTGLSEEETQILKSQITFSQNQCHELKQQVIRLKKKLQQCDAEKEQLELELGMKSFLEDKQKHSEKVLQSFREHGSVQSKSSTACGASCAFTSVEGTQLGGASPLHEPGKIPVIALILLPNFHTCKACL